MGHERDVRFRELGRRQHGAVARDQLLATGFSQSAIGRLIARGLLQQVHEGVYVIGPQRPSELARQYAALLAIRPNPLLSHITAAAHQDLMRAGGIVHVSISTRVQRDLSGVIVHRPRRIDPEDIVRIDGMPMTSVPRTLLDLAQILPTSRLEKAVDAADRREVLDLTAVRGVMDRYCGHRGTRNLRRVLDGYVSTPDAEEGIEREFQLLMDELEILPPLRNVIVEGWLVDCWWPDARLVVELDSKGWHKTWRDHERDRKRDADLLRAGIASLRITYARLMSERLEVARDIVSGLNFRQGGASQPR